MTIMMDMELNHLTEEERDRILNVLRKDEELKQRDAERIRKLKADLKRIRLKGVIKAGMAPDKTCARCRETFGWFFNKGAICPQCQHKICDNCRERMIRDPSRWLCILCYKQMELDAMSGQWFMQKFRRSKRNRKTNKVITGQEIVKASIRRPPQTDEEDGEEGAHGPDNSRTGPNAEDARKVSSNNNSSPKSSRSVGSNVEESSDTQSTASTSPGRKRPDVHDMGFPKESDKQRLLDLIRSKAPVIGKEEMEKPTVEVRKVSLSRYRSDSESSSSSGPSSPQLSARTDSEFRYSDSIRSSIRSVVSGVSAVSSEGRITIVTESNVSDIDSTSFASIQSSSSNLNSPRESFSSIDRSMYDKENIYFKSSDSVIENPAHRQQELKLTTVRTDMGDGPVILEDTEVTVRKVKTSKHADSMSSDSDAEDTTTEQVSKVKFRRISAGKGPGGRSRSPSPDPRSRTRPNDVAANTMSSPETVSNMSEIGQIGGATRGDGQAGGVTNSPKSGASNSRECLSHSTPLPEQKAQPNNDSSQAATPVTLTGGAETDANGLCDQQGNNDNHSIRDKVSVLLAKYGRTELLQNIDGVHGVDKDGGEGASASSVSDNFEKGSLSSGSLSSYDIIEIDTNGVMGSSFEELEWDSDMLEQPTKGFDPQNRQEAQWNELRQAVTSNMSAQQHNNNGPSFHCDHNYEGNFLDDETEDNGYYPNINYEENPSLWAKSHCHDEDSDGLSVITEHTEPDEERGVLAATAYSEIDWLKSRYTEPDEDSKDHGYFTLPSKGAISGGKSMRSTGSADSETSRDCISPCSDIENSLMTESDLSTISDISVTESTQDLISADYKQRNISSCRPDTLDDLVANVAIDRYILAMNIDDMYNLNLKVLDEDSQSLVLPSPNSTTLPKVDSLPDHSSNAQRGFKLSDPKNRYKNKFVSGARKHEQVDEIPTTKKKMRRMRKNLSDDVSSGPSASKSQGQSSDLLKHREGLRKVGVRSHTESSVLKQTEEKPVDESHLASISDLTKMFDHPPPYYYARVTADAGLPLEGDGPVETSEKTSSEGTDGKTEIIVREGLKTDRTNSGKRNTPGTPLPQEIAPIQVAVVTEVQMTQADCLTLVDEEKTLANPEISGARTKKEVAKASKKEKKEKMQAKKDEKKRLKAEKKIKSEKQKKGGSVFLGKSRKKDMQEAGGNTVDVIVNEDLQQGANKRSPSPTVKAVKEKVEGSKSIQLREIICAELEREVLSDVSDCVPKGKTTDTSVSGSETDRAINDSQIETKATSLGHQWKSKPPVLKDQVSDQLQSLKKYREQNDERTSLPIEGSLEPMSSKKANLMSCNMEDPPAIASSLYSQHEIAFLQDISEVSAPAPVSVPAKSSASEVTQGSDSSSGSDSNHEKNIETGNTSDELEEAFLRPRVPTPGGELDERSQNRPHHHYIINESSDELLYVDTESTLTPDPDYTDFCEDAHLDYDGDETSAVLLHSASSDDAEGSDHGKMLRHEDRYRDEEGYEVEGEGLSYSTGTTGSIGRSSYDGSSSMVEALSIDMQESGSLRSSAHSAQNSPGSGSYGSGGEGEVRVPRWSQRNHLKGVYVSYDSLDVLVDDESDTAEERLNPAKVEEDVTLSLDLGPRPEPHFDSNTKQGRGMGYGDRSGNGGGRIGGFALSNNNMSSSSSKIKTPNQSVPRSANQQTGTKQSNGHSPGGLAETSSLTESETGSTGPPSERSSHREHKSSISSVPSINVTHHDNENYPDSPVFEKSVPDHPTAEPPGSSVEESDEVDDVIVKHTSPTHSMHSQKSSSLLSPFSGSKESIVSFYSDAGEGNYGNIPITGDILFGMEYNYKTGSLEVKIKQCRDLAPVDTKKKRSDPYVKVYLLPDKTKSGKRKTRVKKHTLNPVFDEVLKYAITKSELETRTLWVTVWHSDMFGRNDFLGEVTIPLDYYAFDEPSPQWYKLQERNASPMSLLTYKGDLILSLKYVTADNASTNKIRAGNKKRTGKGELHVLVKEARNLTAVRANGFSDPFCKGYLLPDKTRSMKQKTPVVKRDCNPQWNHTLVFEDLTLEDLKDRSLELTVWDHDRFTSNDFLGGLRLNLGTGKIQGKDVDWMDSRGEEVSMWQSMLDRPNCWIDGSLMLRPNMAKRK